MASNPSALPGRAKDIVLGLIGLHSGTSCGMYLPYSFLYCARDELKGWRLGGVADLSRYLREAAKANPVCGGCEVYEDYRQLLRDESIDAIICATHEHLRARVVLDSLNAGKHVYVVAPMCRYLPEAFEIWETAKRTGKIVQVGASDCSGENWHKAAELIAAGKLGPLTLGQDSYMRNSPKGAGNYPKFPWATKDDINWEAWLGDVKTRNSFDAEEYFRSQKYYKYSAGLISDLLPTRLFPMMLAMGPEFPSRVAALGTKKVHTDRGNAPERDCPENMQILGEFPSGSSMLFAIGTVNEQGLPAVIRGHKASLFLSGNSLTLKPETPFRDEVAPQTYELKGSFVGLHLNNWLESIRGNATPSAGIELAIRAQTVLALAEMSDRLSTVCLFDERTRIIRDGSGREMKPFNYGWKSGES